MHRGRTGQTPTLRALKGSRTLPCQAVCATEQQSLCKQSKRNLTLSTSCLVNRCLSGSLLVRLSASAVRTSGPDHWTGLQQTLPKLAAEQSRCRALCRPVSGSLVSLKTSLKRCGALNRTAMSPAASSLLTAQLQPYLRSLQAAVQRWGDRG